MCVYIYVDITCVYIRNYRFVFVKSMEKNSKTSSKKEVNTINGSGHWASCHGFFPEILHCCWFQKIRGSTHQFIYVKYLIIYRVFIHPKQLKQWLFWGFLKTSTGWWPKLPPIFGFPDRALGDFPWWITVFDPGDTSKIGSRWWLNQPSWKICSSKWVHLPQISGWKYKKILKPPPRDSLDKLSLGDLCKAQINASLGYFFKIGLKEANAALNEKKIRWSMGTWNAEKFR